MRLQTTCAVIFCLMVGAWRLAAQVPERNAAPTQAEVVFTENRVEVLRSGSKIWDPAPTNAPYNVLNPGDQLRTLANSRAGLRLPGGQGTFVLGPLSYFALPEHPGKRTMIQILKGRLFNFHRGPPGEILFQTPTVSAIIRGTEFLLDVDDEGTTTINLFNGAVEMTNAAGDLTLTNGEAGIARPGQPPVHTAVITSVNLIQWCLYYPAVLSLNDLAAGDLGHHLGDSLTAYRSGDLIGALKAFPTGRTPATDAERVYDAELLLSVGNIADAQRVLNQIAPATAHEAGAVSAARLAAALERLIEVVKAPASAATLTGIATNTFSATEWLVESYALQSQFKLEAALNAARNATKQAPDFGFAWERAAELEFGFGRMAAAQAALTESLRLAPRNPEALALQGFLLAAKNRTREAAAAFDQAIALDGNLGNAWLGRGLCEMRLGHTSNALKDLEVAAAVEPQRALFRSYLAKVFSTAGSTGLANREIALAKQLDPSDPTAWLYSGLMLYQENQVNAGIRDLEHSEDLNDNRRLFRSRLLLDEDQAVEGANLASVYHDAGMNDVSVREAASAVNDDYLNPSAHLFLSDAYNDLRDPTQFNLRYETVWFNEFLLANMLSPVGGGRLSQTVSQQEYSKLFQQDGFGLANVSNVRSDGMYHQQSSQYGTFGNTSYSLDLDYHHNSGVRVNNDLDSIDWYTTIKQQVTPKDTALAIVEYYNYHSGDNFQYYDNNQAMPNYRLDEYQTPTVVGGWHHEWSPGVDTLFLAGRLADNQHIGNESASQLLLIQNPSGNLFTSDNEPFGVDYHNQLNLYTLELNQVFQSDPLTLVAGGRYQTGTIDTQMIFTNPPGLVPFLFPNASDTASESSTFSRASGYAYLTVHPLDHVWLTGGLTYDDLSYPLNFRNPPLTPGEDHRSQFGPKASAVWEITPQATFRGIFARSLGGVSLDESFRLEPTELAGFPQTFRSLIPESVAGSISAPEYEVYGGALDFKFPSKTYAGIQIEELNSQANRTDGAYTLVDQNAPYVPGSTPETLDYRETAVHAGVAQLLGLDFAAGISYDYDRVKLSDVLPEVPISAYSLANQQNHAVLQQSTAYLLFNHPSGFYARADATWYHQDNAGYSPALPGADFYQENLYCGFRFWNRRCEIQFGILNLGNQDYQLNPLNTYAEIPRYRTYMGQLNFIF